MVSTHTQQYITDFVPNTIDGKSPLAMLAKTCETIGLPDVPTMKKSPLLASGDGKTSMGTSPDLGMKHKSDSPNDKKKERCSPRVTPSTSKSEPLTSTSLPGLAAVGKAPFGALGFPTAFPFYPGATAMMSPFGMTTAAFPGFGMAPAPPAFMGGRVPCPAALMRQPCITPGCTTCATNGASAADMFTNPLFSAYAAMMPTVSGASAGMPSYQALLASAAAAASANAAVAASSSSASVPTSGICATTPMGSVRHTCSWMDSNTGMCGKQFCNTDELTHHMKSHAIASVAISNTAQSPISSPVPSSNSSGSINTPDKQNGKAPNSATSTPSMRFNPYGKSMNPNMMAPAGAAVAAAAAAAAGMQSLPPMPFNPMALHAMYAQRMMTMPHP